MHARLEFIFGLSRLNGWSNLIKDFSPKINWFEETAVKLTKNLMTFFSLEFFLWGYKIMHINPATVYLIKRPSNNKKFNDIRMNFFLFGFCQNDLKYQISPTINISHVSEAFIKTDRKNIKLNEMERGENSVIICSLSHVINLIPTNIIFSSFLASWLSYFHPYRTPCSEYFHCCTS